MRQQVLRKPRFWLLRMLCGGCLLGLFVYSIVTFFTFEQGAVHVQGQVVSVQKETHATGRRGGKVTVARPVVRFIVPATSQEITATAKVRSSRSFAAGDGVALEFTPAEPAASVRVESGLSLLDIAFGVVGVMIVSLGFGEMRRYRRQLRHLSVRSPG